MEIVQNVIETIADIDGDGHDRLLHTVSYDDLPKATLAFHTSGERDAKNFQKFRWTEIIPKLNNLLNCSIKPLELYLAALAYHEYGLKAIKHIL